MFAPCSLGVWPTPLEASPALAGALGLQTLWLKREDLAGGNKMRGLEFLLSGAPPRSVFVTIGGEGSSHALATARAAKTQGHRTAVALFAQPETEASRRVAAAVAVNADLVVRSASVVAVPWGVVRAWRGAHRLGRGTPHWIPGGGADPRAVLGHLLATLELATQLDTAPDAIVVPLGTGGTAAGIALGIAWLGWSTRVVAVRVAPWLVANRWRTLWLARKAVALIRQAGLEFRVPPSSIRVAIFDAMGRGYGHPTETGERARALAEGFGVRLDPTYGAKALSVMMSPTYHAPRTVFWNTFAWP